MAAEPSKREVMQALLERSEARVHFDARRSDVILPERLRGEGHVRLDYGYQLTPPIPDLTLDEAGIHATLSFNRAPFATFVPWQAIYLIADYDGNGRVWQEDIPKDQVDTIGETPTPTPPVPAAPAKKARPSHLKLVK